MAELSTRLTHSGCERLQGWGRNKRVSVLFFFIESLQCWAEFWLVSIGKSRVDPVEDETEGKSGLGAKTNLRFCTPRSGSLTQKVSGTLDYTLFVSQPRPRAANLISRPLSFTNPFRTESTQNHISARFRIVFVRAAGT